MVDITRSTTTWERWTPARAKDVLDNHADPLGRRIDREERDKLVRDMVAGLWDDNGETVKFTDDGICTDGHKRFAAIVEAGDRLPGGELWLQTCRGVPYDSRDSVDVGQPRSDADFVKMHDLQIEGSSKDVAAFARRVWLYRQGQKLRASPGLPKPSPREVAKVIKSDALIRPAFKRGRDLRNGPGIGTFSVNAMAYWLLSRVDDGALEDVFWPGLLTGQNVTGPIIVVRDRLLRAGKPYVQGRDKMTGDEMVCAIVNAWNAFGQDEKIRTEQLYPPRGRLLSANFPEAARPKPGKTHLRLVEVPRHAV